MKNRIYCGLVVIVLIALLNSNAVAQEESETTVTVNSKMDKVDSYTSAWKNEFIFSKIDSGNAISIQIDIPDNFDLSVTSSPVAKTENVNRKKGANGHS